jgi:hypothetical protein
MLAGSPKGNVGKIWAYDFHPVIISELVDARPRLNSYLAFSSGVT